VHPILFRLPLVGAPVYSYGFMLGLAVVCGWNLALLECRRQGRPLALMAWGVPVVIVCALVGSRVLYLANHLDEARGLADWVRLSSGGIVAYGGFLGGLAGAWLVFGRGMGLLGAADLMTPSVALGTALTRIGCLLNGCDFGTPTALPWGLRFPAGSPAWQEHLRAGLSLDGARVTATSDWSLPVHPTQLYESAATLVLFALVWRLRRRARFPGQVFLLFFAGYGVARAAIELVRGDPSRGLLLGLPTSQALGLATALLAVVAWPVLAHRAARAGSESRRSGLGGSRRFAASPPNPHRAHPRPSGGS
jgi:phosphatidylglycerol:prolipoprotein diacylglycerol transferase